MGATLIPSEMPPQVRERTVAKARTLLEALPFIREHSGKVVVIKYGGAAMEQAQLSHSFSEDVSLLQHAGINPVVVHGGGPEVTAVSERLGLESRSVRGNGPTDEATLEVATMVLAGTVNTRIVSELVAGDVPAVGLSGVDGGLILARPRAEPDLGSVGDIERVDVEVLRTLMAKRFVPVIASIAAGTDGASYEVNADAMASDIAVGLAAEKLVYVNDVPGVIGPGGELLSELGVQDVLDLLGHPEAVDGGMVLRLESAVRALKAGVRRVHLLDGRVKHALVLELFTPEGVGTMIAVDVPGAGELESPEPR